MNLISAIFTVGSYTYTYKGLLFHKRDIFADMI